MKRGKIAGIIVLAAFLLLAAKTWCDIIPSDAGLLDQTRSPARLQLLDRNGVPLALSYKAAFNTGDTPALYAIPPLLQTAFITAEDRRFYSHHGIDWHARAGAIWQNLRALHAVRGASTITEQVVRILHPRPRTLWSRWIEGFEAMALETHAGKAQILEFYLNQVPYTAERRGIVQAARYYFNREVATLSLKETLALAVLPRAPSAYDLYRHPGRITPAILRLGQAMALPADQRAALATERLSLSRSGLAVEAPQFIRYLRAQSPASGRMRTTLDANLQNRAEKILAQRLRDLGPKQVHNAALLLADHKTGEILAWAVAGRDGEAIDAVLTPRQPGSAMKPFLYALALDSGWSPATILQDAPVSEKINSGLHRFNNYSHSFYGEVTLREALGNSLNIPAIHTIDFVGVERYLATLRRLGFTSLGQSADFYSEGLALGDGEVSLLELIQAYAALAHHGLYRPLTALMDTSAERRNERVYSDEAASLIGNILSDPWARQLEFGLGSILNMPLQTAVKTGTSTDYHDAWAVGFDSRYVAGIWMGNLNGTPMDGITGSTGPALALHSLFSTLAQNTQAAPLYLSSKLIKRDLCLRTHGALGGQCVKRTDYFLPGPEASAMPAQEPPRPALVRPADGLMLAYDPRLPAQSQAFEFLAQGIAPGMQAQWFLNDEWVATTDSGHYLWPLARGDYRLTLKVTSQDGQVHPADTVSFHVK